MDYNEVYGLRGLKGLATHTVWKKVLRVLKVRRRRKKKEVRRQKYFRRYWLQVGLEELEDALLGAEGTAMGNVPEFGFEEGVGTL